jgi:hypothetical protein
MKKLISLLLVLAMALGIGCAFAENTALPAFVFGGDDPIWAAVENYMLTTDFGFTPEEGGVLIPTPIILKTDMNADETEATVYGNFWIFCYKQNGKNLETTSGGECPGIMKLEKKDDAWQVVSFESAGEGEAYAEDIKKFANGDKELEEEYYKTTGASEDSYLAQYQRAAVANYVEANKLDIEAYQDFGQDPVSVTD